MSQLDDHIKFAEESLHGAELQPTGYITGYRLVVSALYHLLAAVKELREQRKPHFTRFPVGE